MDAVIAAMAAALPCPLYANGAGKGGERAVYGFNTLTFNGARRTVRVKVTIWAASMERGLALEALLDGALVPLSGQCGIAGVTACERNGGGWLTDGDLHGRICYYDLTLRR